MIQRDKWIKLGIKLVLVFGFILLIAGCGKQSIPVSANKDEGAQPKTVLTPVPTVTNEDMQNIIGYKWTVQKRKSFYFNDGNNYEVVLGTSPDDKQRTSCEGQIFLMHYDRDKKSWLNTWYLPSSVVSYSSPEYVFESLNIVQNPDMALIAVQTFGGGNGGFTNLTYFTVSNSGKVSLQKDLFLGNAKVETKNYKIIATGSGSVGIHELSLVDGQVNDKVTSRSEMGDQTSDSTKVYFLLDNNGTVILGNSASIDIKVGDTVVFIPQNDVTKKAFDAGEISIYTNAWNDGPVNMSNADRLNTGNSYTFKKVGTFDFVLAEASTFQMDPKPTFTINVNP